jgi:hypothetical protein
MSAIGGKADITLSRCHVLSWLKTKNPKCALFSLQAREYKSAMSLQRPHEPLNQSSGFPTSNALVLTSRFGTSIRQFDIHAD